MVNAWYIDDSLREPLDESVKRSDRHLNPPEYLTLDELRRKTGVTIETVNVDKYDNDSDNNNIEEELAKHASSKGYVYTDVLDIHAERLDNYSEKLRAFYTEHLHSDDEVRLVLVGSAYFDVRDIDNRWVRIHVRRGDQLNLLAGTYHRFTLDVDNYVKLFRLFGSKPDWSSFNRPADEHPARVDYMSRAVKGF
ncbi:acireductone dioxygenase-like [Oppia nitens]|uniref:acireductone dioxygenase-like n=1 Tax=Oppia nitens TaxID=1686743 RepID=UPI0023DA2912|nr:acireductone dioxygenase-like [Oppia nitens]